MVVCAEGAAEAEVRERGSLRGFGRECMARLILSFAGQGRTGSPHNTFWTGVIISADSLTKFACN
jgi:hypothetical protein